MAVIKSGNSTDQWTVDPISKAGRVTLYDSAGNEIAFPAGLTDAQLRAAPVPVSGAFFQATQPVSGAFYPATQPVSIASMPSTPVTGTFFPATQPVSAVALPLPAGAATDASLTATQPRDVTDRAVRQLGIVDIVPADLAVTATAAVSTAVTLTLPAVAGQFHYLMMLEITKMNGLAITASGTPIIITTTNLPGSLAFTMGNGEGGVTIGASVIRLYMPTKPIKASTVNLATTVVCPLTTGVIWRLTAWYRTGV